jgi:transposase
VVSDNAKCAVIKADLYDPELHPKIIDFFKHYNITLLPTRPDTPRHKGKVERGVDYAQENALKGRTFEGISDFADQRCKECSHHRNKQ